MLVYRPLVYRLQPASAVEADVLRLRRLLLTPARCAAA